MIQTSIDFSGAQLRDIGIKKAIDHANEVTPKWSDLAYQFLLNFIKNNKEFMMEDVRKASEGIIPQPPSARAWGSISVRAVKNKLIERVGFRNVTNAKAHCTPATVWRVI